MLHTHALASNYQNVLHYAAASNISSYSYKQVRWVCAAWNIAQYTYYNIGI